MSLKDQRQALVDTFINAIYLYDDKVLITFNYKEGTQTIPFEKVEESKAKGNFFFFFKPKKRRATNPSGALVSPWLVESRNVYREDYREVRIRGLAAELTAASGGNREAGWPRSDFSKPAQGL